MNRAAMFAQAARGPVLLITVGVLFALQQAGVLPFSRTWPLVIIVIGVMKLIERVLLPRPVFPPPAVPFNAPAGGYPPPGATYPGPGTYPPAGAPPLGGSRP